MGYLRESEHHIGFTGTQEGMTLEQKNAVSDILRIVSPSHAHHGDCIGADKDFHDLCRSIRSIYVIGHPGVDKYGRSPKRAHCVTDENEAELPYLERNAVIVNKSQLVIATPKGYEEELRSGTWSTIRRARRFNRTVFIIYPDGSRSV